MDLAIFPTFRIQLSKCSCCPPSVQVSFGLRPEGLALSLPKGGGDGRARTADLLIANEML